MGEPKVLTALINATVISMEADQPIFELGYVSFLADEIVAVGPMSAYQPTVDTKEIDCSGKIIMPGLINTHTHLGLIPLRSLADDMPDRLRKFLFPMEMKYFNAELVSASALFAGVESLKAGVTTVADMYYFTDSYAEALSELKIRAFLGQTIIKDHAADRFSETDALKEVARLAEKWANHPLIKIMVAPHGSTTVSLETLKQASALAKKYQLKMMIHISEMDYEMAYFRDKYNQTPIEYFAQAGLLGPEVIAVHSIYAQNQDFELLAKSQTNVAHCLTANLKAAKGIMDLKAMQAAGVNVSLGTDGPISGNTLDLWTQIRFVPMVHKTINHDRSYLPSYEILKLATINGAKTLGMADKIGSLKSGKQADLIIIDPNKFNSFPVHDVFATLVYSVTSQNVESVLVAGKWVIYQQELQTMDEKQIFAKLKQAMEVLPQDLDKLAEVD